MNGTSESVSVQLAGPLLACLLYDVVNSAEDQEALLLGERRWKSSCALDDESDAKETQEIVYVIHGFRKIPRHSFYAANAELHEEELAALFPEDQQEHFIGWMVFRRSTLLKPSVREKAVWQNLNEYVGRNPKLFSCTEGLLFGMVCTKASADKATHAHEFTFLRLLNDNSSATKCQVSIPNLVEGTQEEYSSYTSAIPPPSAGNPLHTNLRNILPRSDLLVAEYEDAFRAEQGCLESVVERFAKHQELKESLQKEVRELRAQLEKLEKESDSQASQEPTKMAVDDMDTLPEET